MVVVGRGREALVVVGDDEQEAWGEKVGGGC